MLTTPPVPAPSPRWPPLPSSPTPPSPFPLVSPLPPPPASLPLPFTGHPLEVGVPSSCFTRSYIRVGGHGNILCAGRRFATLSMGAAYGSGRCLVSRWACNSIPGSRAPHTEFHKVCIFGLSGAHCDPAREQLPCGNSLTRTGFSWRLHCPGAVARGMTHYHVPHLFLILT